MTKVDVIPTNHDATVTFAQLQEGDYFVGWYGGEKLLMRKLPHSETLNSVENFNAIIERSGAVVLIPQVQKVELVPFVTVTYTREKNE